MLAPWEPLVGGAPAFFYNPKKEAFVGPAAKGATLSENVFL